MNMYAVFCPHCKQKLDVPFEYSGRIVECPACNKAFTASQPHTTTSIIKQGEPPRKQMDAPVMTFTTPLNSHDIQNRKNLLLINKKQSPDGYSWAMFFVWLLYILAGLAMLVGIALIMLSIIKQNPFYFVPGITSLISGIFGMVLPAFLNLFCGMAKNISYLVAMKEIDIINRD